MLPGAASVIRQAIRSGWSAKTFSTAARSLYGSTTVSSVDETVVAAGELHDDVTTGEATRQPDRRHGGLGAGGDEPDPVDGRARHDLLGQLDLGLGGGAVRRPARDRL